MVVDWPVSQEVMEANDEIVFFLREVAALHCGAQIVHPPQSAAFPTPLQSYKLTSHLQITCIISRKTFK